METIPNTPNPIPTLYQWAGGKEVFEKLTSLFYQKVNADELLSPVFEHMSSEHAKHVAFFIAQVFGGPALYTEQAKGSHSRMVAHHIGKNLDEKQRKRWIHLLIETADEIGLADDAEFRSAFVAYLEWGSRIAVINSHTTTNPVGESEPMPAWGWGETKGPYQAEK
ncbi:group II truncated hemoglobin [Rhodocytophaga aerolata]|uniref:Group II truncated hemoglobin n=1 Tax=Rhodocytophaga aerolata TaxID=455078 RepID=A0ABT8RDI7_9BACT|nr:group II truncated hemoglobin [Rhodocytophaga aerolata]MDO1450164.1 group II truncated hemoglobin [Rhodocytophaga aerolata]